MINSDGDHPNSGAVYAGGFDLNQKEEYLRQVKIEIEAEGRKLEEYLEYQRKIENEAKQKHLVEQHKKDELANLKGAAALPGVYFPIIDNDAELFVQVKHCKKVSVCCSLFLCY